MIVTIRCDKPEAVGEDDIAGFIHDAIVQWGLIRTQRGLTFDHLSINRITVGTETFFLHNGVLTKLKKIF